MSEAAPLNILVVDDHADTTAFLARLLRMQGWNVGTAGSVAEALDESGRRPFDLLICDLGLPDGDGCALVRQLLAEQRIAPSRAIALTGATLDHDVAQTHAAGFAAHLPKPVEFDALLRTVRTLTCGT